MKKLIGMIVLISIAFGQEPIDLSTSTVNITGARYAIPENAKYFQMVSVGDILDYAEICNKDSSYVGDRYVIGESFYDDGTLSTMMTGTYRFDDNTYWKDRPFDYKRIEKIYEPTKPTFEGFAKWIRSKQ